MNVYIYYYLIAVNMIAFAVSGLDKHAAIHGRRRVSEKTLFSIAIIGGSIGLFISMLFFRHKTKHWYFMIGVPVLILGQIIFYLYLHHNLGVI